MGYIDKYWSFDVAKFLKDYPDYVAERERLQHDLDEISEISSPRTDGVIGVSGVGDTVARTAERRDVIRNKIAKVEEILSMYKKAFESLSAEEMLIINKMFFEKGLLSSNVRFLMQELGYERSEIYRRREKALDHVLSILGLNR